MQWLDGRKRNETQEEATSMTMLLVGFDSAWTPTNSGALVGVLRANDGTLRELGSPHVVSYSDAEARILEWQSQQTPGATIVMLDQPTIVNNASGQRPVENLVGSPVSRRSGGMQPANTAREEMFGKHAPVWRFLNRFGGPADPLAPLTGTWVVETYPVLTMIALDWTLPDSRPTGRVPKYNPARRHTFSIADWQHVCQMASSEFRERRLPGVSGWLDSVAQENAPRKSDQDGLDSCVCLLAALYLAETRVCLMVGNRDTGYIVVPYGESLSEELNARCEQTGRKPSEWVRSFRLSAAR
jgi:predicted RNase H-like nuclease